MVALFVCFLMGMRNSTVRGKFLMEELKSLHWISLADIEYRCFKLCWKLLLTEKNHQSAILRAKDGRACFLCSRLFTCSFIYSSQPPYKGVADVTSILQMRKRRYRQSGQPAFQELRL